MARDEGVAQARYRVKMARSNVRHAETTLASEKVDLKRAKLDLKAEKIRVKEHRRRTGAVREHDRKRRKGLFESETNYRARLNAEAVEEAMGP